MWGCVLFCSVVALLEVLGCVLFCSVVALLEVLGCVLFCCGTVGGVRLCFVLLWRCWDRFKI